MYRVIKDKWLASWQSYSVLRLTMEVSVSDFLQNEGLTQIIVVDP